MAALEQALAQLPKLFTKTNEDTVVLAKTSHDGALAVTACTPQNDAYEGRYDQESLQKMGASDFKLYFDTMTDSFNKNKCTSASSGGGYSIDVPGCGRFELAKAGMNGHSFMLENIISFTKLRTSKDPDRLLEEANTRAVDASAKVGDLEEEARSLQHTITICREKVTYNHTRIKDLESELAELQLKKKNAAGEDAEAEEAAYEEEEDVISRVRNPLGEIECKEYDLDLLRMVKGQFMDFSEESAAAYDSESKAYQYCKVVRPMTNAAFEKLTEGFSEPLQQTVHKLLEKIDDWDYDVFGLQEAMCGSFMHEGLVEQPRGGSLFITAYALLHRYGFMQKFNINEKIMLNWLSLVESGYHPNPYHNSMHAADVLHVTHYILSPGDMINTCRLCDEDVFAAIMAAIIHDYNHPGINNNFHIKVQTYLATLFNDRSILENIHVSSVFELMKTEQFNVLECFEEEKRRDIRETLVEMVLATDMGLHAKILGSFKRRLADDDFRTFKRKDDIRLALSMAVKMADISNCGRDQKLYLGWCNQIADEFYMQGDRERNLGFPCSPFMDRFLPAMAKGQIAFMNYIVVPLFECISELIPKMHFSVDLTEENKAYWTQNDDS
eukprot:TRINITY_DN12937_c0_g1_i1.p1 TRINITY_DN12937_c0_g1~~TRINITY_DN12937_c0_g1_i1.p1  ORF type:complete len:612 (+),score=251.28 TRINITY_DN12937_c0_g1_i1:100-1935(+)